MDTQLVAVADEAMDGMLAIDNVLVAFKLMVTRLPLLLLLLLLGFLHADCDLNKSADGVGFFLLLPLVAVAVEVARLMCLLAVVLASVVCDMADMVESLVV